MKAILKIFIIASIAALSILSVAYFFSARFYGNFHCILLDENNNIITDNYVITGVTFFNYEYNLAKEQQHAYWSPDSYYKRLILKHETGEYVKSVIFYNEKLNIAYKKTDCNNEINNMGNSFTFQNLQMKLDANPLLRISLLSCIFFILLGITLSVKFWIRSIKSKKIIYVSVVIVITSLILFFLFIPQPQHKEQKELTDTYSIDLNSGCQNLICMTNNSGQPVEFTFSIDGKFWWDKDSLLNYISRIPVKDTFSTSKFIIQAWKFVYENTFHCYQNYPKASFDNFDCYLLNSIGHGLCGDRATLFCDIVGEKGYKTRILNRTDVHSFPEVFDGKWKMMDVDHGICFRGNNSEILSTEEILNGTAHTHIPAMDKMSFFSNALTFFIDCPSKLNSGEDYDFDHITYSANNLKLSNFLLPGNSTIKMPIYDSVLMEYTAKISISKVCHQIIRIPLFIIDNNADMFVKCSSFDYLVSGENIEITALLNPMLFINAKRLAVYSTNNLNINVAQSQDSTDIYYILSNFTNNNYDTLRFLYKSNLFNIQHYEDSCPIEIPFIRQYSEKLKAH